jgi:hypothetical protein
MKLYNQHLDNLGEGYDQLLAFDCEFWRVSGASGFSAIPKTTEFFTPRELAGFFIKKDEKGRWEYSGHFFVTFSPPKNKDVSFVSSEFASVSAKTAEEMNKYQSVFQSSSEVSQDLINESVKVYLADKHIKNNHKPNSWIKTFLKEFQKSRVIVKGTYDLDALKNMCVLHGYDYPEPAGIFDIAEWNTESHKICGTAKLEGTYDCISRNIDDSGTKTRRLRDILPLGRAHDPASDAAMTFLIAIYIVAAHE